MLSLPLLFAASNSLAHYLLAFSRQVPYHPVMISAGRKSLPHDLPLRLDIANAIFFLTVCAQNRNGAPLLKKADGILDSIRFRHTRGEWFVRLAVVMPDHVHLLAQFPQHVRWKDVVSNWKRWTSRNLQIGWQRDFFDHRLRDEENLREKADYIIANPVRAGLVEKPEDWPHLWINRELV